MRANALILFGPGVFSLRQGVMENASGALGQVVETLRANFP